MSVRKIFDETHYERINAPRVETLQELLSELMLTSNLRTAIDVGCGLGYFSQVMAVNGLQVTAVDGRQENVDEARKRYPEIPFFCFDVQDASVKSLGKFDFVLCFGLLYHLENPLMAIRHLQAMTARIMVAESVIYPGDEPIMALVDEQSYVDQGLNHIAFYPTEACLIKMMYRAGYPFVFKLAHQPSHPDYKAGSRLRRVRTILAASREPIRSMLLQTIPEPRSSIRPWDATSELVSRPTVIEKLKRLTRGAVAGKGQKRL